MSITSIREKPRALIVDDDRDIAALFRHVLDMAGFEAEAVLSGKLARERLKHSCPDLILLDLNLPGVSGRLLLETIRKNPKLAHTKVVVISGFPRMAEDLPIQPDLVLLKPVSVEQLSDLVRRLTLSERSSRAVPLRKKPFDRRTGLYNQHYFTNRIESAIRRAREIDGYLYTVLLFSLEQQKKAKIQKRSASHMWESVLMEIAAALRTILRPTDTIARFDHDKFYILIEDVPNGEIAVRIANRIQQILYKDVPDIVGKIRLPIRIGVLLCDQEYDNVDMVLNDAKYSLTLAIAQGDEYAKYYYQVSSKKTKTSTNKHLEDINGSRK